MKFHHLRNATALLTLGEHRLLVDPMLAEAGSLPGFKMFGAGRRPNPLVPLPPTAAEALASATGVLVTHEHPDHFDRAAIAWIRRRGLPVWASPIDAPNLRKKGLDVREVGDGALGLSIEIVPARHGRGPLAWLMGPVSGYWLAHPDEPSVYLTSDAVLTGAVLEAIERLRPDVVVAPAGAANMGAGGDILFSLDELVTLVRRAPGRVVLNHLEALDHCPTTREALRARMQAEGLLEKVAIPDDGAELQFERGPMSSRPRPRPLARRRPGLQKWLTARLTMT
jgi:L-ascorbate metabolism protein UlaG (beta-lactamase superfamily)